MTRLANSIQQSLRVEGIDVSQELVERAIDKELGPRLVRCPDAPCDDRCIWCCGSGWIAPTTLKIYLMKRDAGSRDTDKEQEAVKG